jgi:hypothetical protein
MGRPLNKKYFGNRNIGSSSTTADNGIGGEGVASVTVGGTNNSSGYTTGDSVTFTAPQLPGGVTATGTIVANGGGAIVSITITEKGSGYTTAPTVTASTGTIGTTTLTAVLTTDSGSAGSSTNQENAIIGYAYVTGGSSRVIADIKKQTNDRRYKVTTAQGTSICQLRTDGGDGEGTMDITAYDSDAGEYWVWKLTSRKAVLVQKGVGGGTQFATGTSVPWTLGNAVASYSVKIQNA